MNRPNVGLILSAGGLAVALVLAYRPGLYGGYMFDDLVHIVSNPHLRIDALTWDGLLRAAESAQAGPLGRPLTMASFALNIYAFGNAAYFMKLVNLAIHLLNAGLVFWLAALLLRCAGPGHETPEMQRRRRWAALAVAFVWAAHPVNVTGVLYAVQRMTSLSASFALLGLIGYCRVRMGGGRAWAAAAVLGLMAVPAAFAKENGALVFVYAALTEFLLLRFAGTSPGERRLLKSLFAATVLVPAFAVLWQYGALSGHWVDPYPNRNFNLPERLLTEARVLWSYARMVLVPDISHMALFHDDFPVSRGWLSPPGTAIAVLGHSAAIVAAVLVRRRAPLVAWGVISFYAGHAAEATVIPLEIMFEHRNYLPMLGLLVPIAGAVLALERSLDLRRLPALLGAGFAIACLAATTVRASQMDNPLTFVLYEAERRPGSSRANHEAARVLLAVMLEDPKSREALEARAIRYLDRSIALDPDILNPYFTALSLPVATGKPLPDRYLAELEARLRTVPPPNGLTRLMVSLTATAATGALDPSGRRIERLYEAVLDNPRISRRQRADTHFGLALYLAGKGEHDPSFRQAEQGHAIAGTEPFYDILLANVYALGGRRTEALALLDQAERKDTRDRLRREREAVRRLAEPAKAP